jgi:hypothetical protein
LIKNGSTSKALEEQKLKKIPPAPPHFKGFSRVCQILLSKSCVLPTFKKICQVRPSPRVCQILLDKSCVLPTSKKICQVKKEFISNNLA